jgi:hypothetical protein
MSLYDRYVDQSRSHGLPGDEYTRLRLRDLLNTHFEHRENRNAACSKQSRSAYRDAGLLREERVHISEVRRATRAALGSGFDFMDNGYERSRRCEDSSLRSWGWIDHEPHRDSIPQKYQDEFNKLWHEDDEANDALQYRADRTRNAPWRDHVMLERSRLNVETLPTRRSGTSAGLCRVDSGYSGGNRRPITLTKKPLPVLTSKFSFESLAESYQERPHRHSYLSRFHRD